MDRKRAPESIPFVMESPPSEMLGEKPLPTPKGLGVVPFKFEKGKHAFRTHVSDRLPQWFRISGWRATVTAGACVSSVVLLINLILLIWSLSKPVDPTTGQRLLAAGDCNASQTAFTWSHFAINILSTLLLGSSNAAMQCLSAPSREAVDRAHAKGQWLDIGISGFRNWSGMDTWRKVCWVLLAFSSLPLHLLYNSAIFSTTSGNEYYALAVTEGFLNNQTFSLPQHVTGTEDSTGLPALLAQLQANASAGELKRLENNDCIQAYSGFLTSQYSNVLLVSSFAGSSNNSLLDAFQHTPTPAKHAVNAVVPNANWICGYSGSFEDCDTDSWLKNASDWTIYSSDAFPIEYCLAQETNVNCSVQIIPIIMAVVVACNAFKTMCFLYASNARDFLPLITLGDALESFLACPDHHTEGFGALSAQGVRDADKLGRFKRAARRRRSTYAMMSGGELPVEPLGAYPLPVRMGPWKARNLRWFSGASSSRWYLTYALIVVIWLAGWVVFACAGNSDSAGAKDFASQWSIGFGNVSPDLLLEATSVVPLFGNIVIANFPQVVISAVYLSYNGLFTSILLSREFTQYTIKRSGLRVTYPTGRYQRSTYYLSLPYRYSMPLLVAAFLLHWFASQSLFLAEVTVFDAYGAVDETFSVNCLGYSTLALLFTMVLGTVMILIPLGMGYIRYDSRAPLVESCSIAISATCHPHNNRSDEAFQLLRYGMPVDAAECNEQPSLSSGIVKALEAGHIYGDQDRNPPELTDVDTALFHRHHRPVFLLLELFHLAKIALGALTVTVAGNLGASALEGSYAYAAFPVIALVACLVTCVLSAIRMIVETVRFRKKKALRVFGWHVFADLLVLMLWTVLLYAASAELTASYGVSSPFGYYHTSAPVTFAAVFSVFLLYLGSMGIEFWLWWELR